jgi:uncharacterized protein YeaO (DUF488 family)
LEGSKIEFQEAVVEGCLKGTLLFSAQDAERNNAVVLPEVLET